MVDLGLDEEFGDIERIWGEGLRIGVKFVGVDAENKIGFHEVGCLKS